MGDTIASVGIEFESAAAENNMRSIESAAKRVGVSVDEMAARVEAAGKGIDLSSVALGKGKKAVEDYALAHQKSNIATVESAQQSQRYAVQANAVATAAQRAAASLAQQSQQIGVVTSEVSRSLSHALGMFGLAGIGVASLIEAAKSLYEYLRDQGPTVEKTFAEQNRLLGVLKDSYDRTTDAARKWFEQSRDVTQLQLLQQQIDLQKKLNEEVGKQVSKATTFDNLGDFFSSFGSGQQIKQIKEQLLPFEDALFKLQDGFKQGAPNVREFVDEVARITLLTPALQKMGADLVASLGDASKFENALKQVDAAMRLIKGGHASEEDRSRLGLPDPRRATASQADPFGSAVLSANKHISAMNADAEAVGKTAGEHARLRTEAQLLEVAQNKGATATEEQRKKITELGKAASDAATKLRLAQINDQISFGSRTSLLSPEDVQIATQLKDIFPDVAEGLASVQAAGMRVNSMMSTFSSSASSAMVTGLADISDHTKSVSEGFRGMAKSVLRSLEEMVIKAAIVTPIFRALQSALGGGSGLLGMLGLGGGGGGAAASAATLAGNTGGAFYGPGFANGGTLTGGWGVVGERGAELINVHSGGVTVIPNDVSRPFLPGFANGGSMNSNGNVIPLVQDNGQQQTHVTVGVKVDNDGNLQAYVKDISTKTVSGYVKSPSFTQHVGAAANKAAKLRVGR